MTQQLSIAAEQHALTVDQNFEKLDSDGKLPQLATSGDIKKLDVNGQMRLLDCFAKDPPRSLDEFNGDANAMFFDFVMSILEGAILLGVKEAAPDESLHKGRTREACIGAVRALRAVVKQNGLSRESLSPIVSGIVYGVAMSAPLLDEQKEKASRTRHDVVDRIRLLREEGYSDQKIAMTLNSERYRTRNGTEFTKGNISSYRHEHEIP